MTLQEVMEMMRDKDEGSDRPDIARFSPEEISSRDKDRQESFDAIGRRDRAPKFKTGTEGHREVGEEREGKRDVRDRDMARGIRRIRPRRLL